MPEMPRSENNCQTDGIFSPVAGVLGSLQANEVLKTILGFNEDFNNKMIIFVYHIEGGYFARFLFTL